MLGIEIEFQHMKNKILDPSQVTENTMDCLPRTVLIPVRPLFQVYFFCSASVSSQPGPQGCTPQCKSEQNSESGLDGGGGTSCHIRPPAGLGLWSPARHHKSPCVGRRRSLVHLSDKARPQDIVSSLGPVGFEDSSRQKLTPKPAGTEVGQPTPVC